jgi:hypothetical protein
VDAVSHPEDIFQAAAGLFLHFSNTVAQLIDH